MKTPSKDVTKVSLQECEVAERDQGSDWCTGSPPHAPQHVLCTLITIL